MCMFKQCRKGGLNDQKCVKSEMGLGRKVDTEEGEEGGNADVTSC